MEDRKELEQRLQELAAEIEETKRRLPAHSIKPPVMIDLLALEDQYYDVLTKLRSLKENRQK